MRGAKNSELEQVLKGGLRRAHEEPPEGDIKIKVYWINEDERGTYKKET